MDNLDAWRWWFLNSIMKWEKWSGQFFFLRSCHVDQVTFHSLKICYRKNKLKTVFLVSVLLLTMNNKTDAREPDANLLYRVVISSSAVKQTGETGTLVLSLLTSFTVVIIIQRWVASVRREISFGHLIWPTGDQIFWTWSDVFPVNGNFIQQRSGMFTCRDG